MTRTRAALFALASCIAVIVGGLRTSPILIPATTCTNQFIRSIAAATGIGTCATVNLASDITGTLPIANGGCNSSTGCVAVVKKQIFTSNGTYTPSTGLLYAIIECVGSGAGGGGVTGSLTTTQLAGGGGGGSYSRAYASAATVGSSQTVTVGTGGAGGIGSNNGGVGNDVSVGSLCVGKGGSGGLFAQASVQNGFPGAGGAAGTGDFTSTGGVGTLVAGSASITTVTFLGGSGGGSLFGGGGIGGTASANGGAASLYGAGGGGAISTNENGTTHTGGAGSKGVVIITEFTNQ